jgi:Golgi nucleoside diphosphatase
MIKSRRMRWEGHAGRMGETMNAYRILVGKPEGKIGWDGMDRIDLAQNMDQ